MTARVSSQYSDKSKLPEKHDYSSPTSRERLLETWVPQLECPAPPPDLNMIDNLGEASNSVPQNLNHLMIGHSRRV